MTSNRRDIIDWERDTGLAGRLLADAVARRAREINLNGIRKALPFVVCRLADEVDPDLARHHFWSAVDDVEECMFAWWNCSCAIQWTDDGWARLSAAPNRAKMYGVDGDDVAWWLARADELLSRMWHVKRDDTAGGRSCLASGRSN